MPQNNNLNHESWGVWISGSNNIFELLNTHHNMGPGLFIQGGGNNLVLNCDSHDNYDPMTSNGAGQSADGFGAHEGGTGNVFRGCRAWWNSDDGYDFIHAQEVVIVENSWAWYSGYLPGTTTRAPAGNGNGIKGGGFDLPPTRVPSQSTEPHRPQLPVVLEPRQRLRRQLRARRQPLVQQHRLHERRQLQHARHAHRRNDRQRRNPEKQHRLRRSGHNERERSMVDAAYNSWDAALGVSVSAADFQSTSITGMDGPRQADGSLPCPPFMRLAQGSDLIDKGQNVSLPFSGSAPDLGAFEYGPCASSTGTGGAGGAAEPAARRAEPAARRAEPAARRAVGPVARRGKAGAARAVVRPAGRRAGWAVAPGVVGTAGAGGRGGAGGQAGTTAGGGGTFGAGGVTGTAGASAVAGRADQEARPVRRAQQAAAAPAPSPRAPPESREAPAQERRVRRHRAAVSAAWRAVEAAVSKVWSRSSF